MKKSFLVVVFLLFESHNSRAGSVLENSIWGSAATYAGINVSTLYGIATQESGMRWKDGTFRPWPWTLNVNIGGNGIKAGSRRYESKLLAEKGLKEIINAGISNVDVGIMQVNLFWHRNKVSNDLALLDPITNINVAAQYLRDINKKNINKTVSDYHAPTNPVLGNKYVNHVKKYEKIIHEKIK
jgi:hypothetical protein